MVQSVSQSNNSNKLAFGSFIYNENSLRRVLGDGTAKRNLDAFERSVDFHRTMGILDDAGIDIFLGGNMQSSLKPKKITFRMPSSVGVGGDIPWAIAAFAKKGSKDVIPDQICAATLNHDPVSFVALVTKAGKQILADLASKR